MGNSERPHYVGFVSLPIILVPEAELDITKAALWYERRSSGLGADFIDCIDACFALIAEQPHIFPIIHRQARMALPRKFPYLVTYRVFPDFISIVA